MTSATLLDDVETCVDEIIRRVGTDIRVGLSLGLGKPPELINALYQRAKADPSIRLTILTALTLEKPVAKSDVEAAFLEPFLQRVFEGVVSLDYAQDVSAKSLPANVRVVEFYFRPGSRMDHPQAQRDHVSTNYTFAARDLMAQGCNVCMQAIAKRMTPQGLRYSLSCNPDIYLEMIGRMRDAQLRGERRIALVGVVNQRLPYMGNDAEVTSDLFDLVVDNPVYTRPLFSTPKRPVSTADHAIGLYVSSLIADGGTLQIGIGSLGDAITHALRIRHQHSLAYRQIADRLGMQRRFASTVRSCGGFEPFRQGLYGASEMFVDGFLHLMHAGILTRRVYDCAALQRIINRGLYDPATPPSAHTLKALSDEGLGVIGLADFRVLQHHGVFDDTVRHEAGFMVSADGLKIRADLADADARTLIANHCLGRSGLRRGIVLHAGFFVGPADFYEGLRALSQDARDAVCMTGVFKTNQLQFDPDLYVAQRRDARFINAAMMVTLAGAVVSDGLDDGRVVSGVGGQYNFVAMAHQLESARSILMVHAVHEPHDGGPPGSNIVFSYAHCTIPRHLRDIVVTEYGIADLRSASDSEIAKRLIHIADSRFQKSLLEQAKAAGRIEADYVIPPEYRNNTPENLVRIFQSARDLFPDFPLGCDFTPEEQLLLKALKLVRVRVARTPAWRLFLQHVMSQLQRFLLALAARSVSVAKGERVTGESPMASTADRETETRRLQPLFKRMRLEHPADMRSRIIKGLLTDALEQVFAQEV